MTKVQDLNNMGQSIWFDYIRRSFITSGELQALIDQGVRGVTSNPAIFEKAIVGSSDYDQELQDMVAEGKSEDEIYEALALDDIARAADLMKPVYAQTNGADGYVSMEVNPALAHDTQGTVAEARRLFGILGRPNVMIKVPATPAGIPAIETLIGEGININVTLIFSLAQYQAVAEAYIAGLETLIASGGDLSQVSSVASFFVSRVDTAVDRALEEIGEAELQGKIAIANAKVAYAHFRELFSGPRWEKLESKGARVQRPLWASTGTKNPHYPDTQYVDSLIGPHTVNTVPPATLQAFLNHGAVSPTLETELEEANTQLRRLSELSINLDDITQQLQDDGVAAFAKSFESLMTSIAEKRDRLLAEWELQSTSLGSYHETVEAALDEVVKNRVIARIWAHDHTVWKPEPTEITNRLGWLHTAEVISEHADHLQALVKDVQAAGFTLAVLLGMGGSSLAPEVFRRTFGVAPRFLDLAVLDSTDPDAVSAHARSLDPARTLFIVSTKSGGTVETLSFFKFFYKQIADQVGADQAGEHFIAITDPGSRLADLAQRYHFRATFLNDTNIGGRYSALSYFGLVPAALVGVDVPRLLHDAMAMACATESCVTARENPGAVLGAILGELAKVGRDKVTFITSPEIASFGDWVEQLIAESTGKEGKGILPVVGEPVAPPSVYGDDRLFVYMRLDSDHTHDADVQALEDAGHPVVRLRLRNLYDLGGQFFLWEMATAVASSRLEINPFDQPNVEAAKVLARQMVAAYQEQGALPQDELAPLSAEALDEFLNLARRGDYIAIHAYLTPTADTDTALQAFRTRLRNQFQLATTVGYGPRFLHSTGQLHKGDSGNGLFIQFTADAAQDVPIPDEAGSPDSSITFGVLKTAQALGDKQALIDAQRRVIRFHLGRDVVSGLKQLAG
jgi:transaldolase/glucose-6-phosphate isomerase